MTVSLSSLSDFLRENVSSRSVSFVKPRPSSLEAFTFVPRAYVVRQDIKAYAEHGGFSPLRFPERRISEDVTYAKTISPVESLTLLAHGLLTNLLPVKYERL